MSQKRRERKLGVFAIEGEWLSDLRGGLSFRPVLELLNKVNNAPYVHRDAATRDELFYYLKKWTQKRYEKYPVLYLGFHGVAECILIGDERYNKCEITLDEMMDALEDSCHKRIVYFGSCSTMQIDGRRLQTFLKRTGALAVCGYRKDVDMLKSAAFELLLLDILLSKSMTIQGARAMERQISSEERALCKELGFRMVVRKTNH